MKYGHVESTLKAATPRSWRDDVTETISSHPDVVLIIGGGVVALICLVALCIGWALRQRRHPD
jgi:hypothetical protein